MFYVYILCTEMQSSNFRRIYHTVIFCRGFLPLPVNVLSTSQATINKNWFSEQGLFEGNFTTPVNVL